MSEDELRMMVDQGMASGVLHAAEHRMVHGALGLDQITAEKLMTPCNRVVWLNLDDSDEVNWRKVVASGHTWFPVFKGSPDRPLGVVSVKRLWANLSLVGSAVIRDLLTDAPTVTQQSTGTQLLERFRRDKLHLALVIDEFGHVRGVVSLNDVLEVIVGELPNEGSPVAKPKPIRRRDDGSWLVDAVVTLDDFREATGIVGRFPSEGSGGFTVIAGFIMRALGRIPEEGDLAPTEGSKQRRARGAARPTLRESERVRVDLAGMQQIGEGVDHRHRARGGEPHDVLVVEGADDEPVDEAGEDARGILDRLASAKLDLTGGEEEGIAAKLTDADLEADARPGGGFREEEAPALARQRCRGHSAQSHGR
jgi:CBS domain containing-hemolysin-like protein